MPVPAGAIAERRVVEQFIAADALRPSDAIEFKSIFSRRLRAFERLKQGGVIKSATGGWYLDEDAWTERRSKRRKRAALLVGAGLVVGAVLSAL
ncbi:hypothetical protein [Tsuneonella mangrovi]|uniref:hypothetical protein n=1 Tax=Tsuneonella mangrovi TaxID=1982042 RepID=UPI0012376470|nr:hypothetical protein [Tsuneonella mangrovi]